MTPRLLTLVQAAQYLGLALSTTKALVGRGILPKVVLPGQAGTDLRRTLLDRLDLDTLIEARKQ